jgi:VanZ family protein
LRYAALSCFVAAIILLVSLYPFRFRAPSAPLQILWKSVGYAMDPTDFGANVLLYLPIGFFATLSLPGRSRLVRIALPWLLGTVLSVVIELVQTFDGARAPNLWDCYSNSAGTFLGALAACTASLAAVFPSILVMCWAGFRLISTHFFPAMSSEPRPVQGAQFVFAWLSIALLLESLTTPKRSRSLLALLFASVLAFEIWLGPEFPLAEIAGGFIALLVWSAFLWRVSWRATAIAVLFALYISIDALRPFHFLVTPHRFGWMPFLSFIQSPRESLVSTTFMKVFMYGTLVWTAHRAGWTLVRATLVSTALVFAQRLFQVYLPGRTAEITDPLMVLLMGATLKLMEDVLGLGKRNEPVADAPNREEMARTGGVQL